MAQKQCTAFSVEVLDSFFLQSFISVNNYEPADFGSGTKLTVIEPGHEIQKPTSVKVLGPSAKECRHKISNKRKKTIVCVASGFYPDHVSVRWEKTGEKVTDGVATDNAALRDGKVYKITSRLRVFKEDWFEPANNFTCIVSFFNGTETIYSLDWISGEEDKSAGGEVITREKYLRITHSAKLSYSVFIVKSSVYGAFVAFLVWKLQGSSGKQNN